MPETNEAAKDKLQKLRESFAAQLPYKVNQVRETWDKVKDTDAGSEEMKKLVLMLHTLAGSAPSFGFNALGSTAREMEKSIKDQGDSLLTPALKGKLETFLQGMMATTGICSEKPIGQVPVLPGGSRGKGFENTNRNVFIVDDDAVLAEHLAVQIACFGYEVRFFTELQGFKRAVASSPPAAIIADICFPEGELAGAEAIMEIRRGDCQDVPVIFMSQRNHLEARINGVRAGGEAYFLKPVPMSDLIEKLDSVVFLAESEPYRVLIVDDDAELSQLHAAILQQHGMTGRVVNDPMQILKHLVGFKPDLVLLDMYMPGCNGHELARAIRQIEDYDGIPIVYLSSETSIDKQMDAIRMGGDAFLTKPIHPEFLISSVSIKAERMRAMRRLMARDSLTGLLNLANTEEHLETLLVRAKKSNTTCAFAVLELDNFKAVNDDHGYLTGDRVIVVTSLLLKRRLRASDVVGRYGGRKFAVIMPETDAETAFNVMEKVRASFARILHECHKGEFSLTLSCGIAVYPKAKDVAALNSDAMSALSNAKNKGKNRVELAAS